MRVMRIWVGWATRASAGPNYGTVSRDLHLITGRAHAACMPVGRLSHRGGYAQQAEAILGRPTPTQPGGLEGHYRDVARPPYDPATASSSRGSFIPRLLQIG